MVTGWQLRFKVVKESVYVRSEVVLLPFYICLPKYINRLGKKPLQANNYTILVVRVKPRRFGRMFKQLKYDQLFGVALRMKAASLLKRRLIFYIVCWTNSTRFCPENNESVVDMSNRGSLSLLINCKQC